jgi:hypothetical protein
MNLDDGAAILPDFDIAWHNEFTSPPVHTFPASQISELTSKDTLVSIIIGH